MLIAQLVVVSDRRKVFLRQMHLLERLPPPASTQHFPILGRRLLLLVVWLAAMVLEIGIVW